MKSNLFGWLHRCAIVLGLSLFSFSALAAGKANEIEYGHPESPPLSATNSRGESEGMLVNLAAALFKKADISWRAAGYPAARLFSNLNDGTTNFSILVNSSALSSCCLVSRIPVFTHELRAYYLGDKPAIKSKTDLIGKSLITIRGYTYAGMISFVVDEKNRIDNHTAASHRSAFDMLNVGRADYLLDYGVNAPEALTPAQLAKLKYDVIGNFDVFLVLSKNYPNAEQVMARLEGILKTLDRDQIFKNPR